MLLLPNDIAVARRGRGGGFNCLAKKLNGFSFANRVIHLKGNIKQMNKQL